MLVESPICLILFITARSAWMSHADSADQSANGVHWLRTFGIAPVRAWRKVIRQTEKKKLQRLHQYQVPGGSPVVAADLDSLKQEDLSSAFRSFCLIDHLIHPWYRTDPQGCLRCHRRVYHPDALQECLELRPSVQKRNCCCKWVIKGMARHNNTS